MSNTGPTATGKLAATPLSNLLVYSFERQLDGSLVFESREGAKSAMTLRAGRVVNTRLGVPAQLLGEVAVGLGLVTPEQVRAALERSERELGGALVEQGLAASDLDAALSEQTFQHIATVAALPGDTVYGFYPGRDFLERWGGPRPPAEPLAAAWRAVRAGPLQAALDMARRLEGLPVLKLHRYSRVARFGFSPRETALLDLLRAKPLSYEELSKMGLLGAEDIARVLCVLALTRHLDLGGDAYPVGVERAQSGPPRATAPVSSAKPPAQAAPDAAQAAQNAAGSDDQQRVAEIQDLHDRLDGLDYYTLLGVSPSADATAIQAGFFQLARKWHPDKLPAALSAHGEKVTRIFARITEAHRVLSTPAQRAEYDRLNQEGGDSDDEQAKVQQVLRAITAFQKAEVLARRGDWAQVVKFAEQAFADDAEQAEYGALLAFARVKAGAKEPSDFDRALAMLNAAVERQPKNLRVKLYRAQVFKQAGKTNEAMRDFRAIVEADPTNVDAQRELRLFKMRKGEGMEEAKPEATGRLFGKLFGKE